jgi:hypothetical protein
MNRMPLGERFWSKVQKTDGCWLWTATHTRKGYGLYSLKYDTQRKGDPHVKAMAHRLAYEELVGSIPKNMFVCHRCDNPGCVNPAHLFLGSALTNAQDAIAKGRLEGRMIGRKSASTYKKPMASDNVPILPSETMPMDGMVLIWGWLCSKCSRFWKPRSYSLKPGHCPRCNNPDWDQEVLPRVVTTS